MLISKEKINNINYKNRREKFGTFDFMRKNKKFKIGRPFTIDHIKPKNKIIEKKNLKIYEDIIKQIILIIMRLMKELTQLKNIIFFYI